MLGQEIKPTLPHMTLQFISHDRSMISSSQLFAKLLSAGPGFIPPDGVSPLFARIFPHLGALLPPASGRDVPTMGDEPGSDLDRLIPQTGQRPVLDFLRQCQDPHEVGQIVREGVNLESHLVVAERAAQQPGPLDGVPAGPGVS